MQDVAQEKSKLFFVFPQNTDAQTIADFNVSQLKIVPAMFPNHMLVVSTAPSEQSEDFLNKVGPGAQAINNVQNLLNLETVFAAINKAVHAHEFNGSADLLKFTDNEDGSKTVTITQCVTVKPVLNEHNFFFKIFLQTTPFTAHVDQETGKLTVDQETLDSVTVADILEPELYVTDTHGNLYHPESVFKMRSHGVRNPHFNLGADELKRGVRQTLLQDQAAWVAIIKYSIPQILEKKAVV